MTSKRSHEGVILIDSRFTPGVPDEMMVMAGLPVGAGRGLFEAPTYTCSHCQHVVIMNPLRTRERGYCKGCDHYLCDGCGAARAALGGKCLTFKQIIEEEQERAALAEQRGSLILSA
jgi:hypothetical protein